MSFRRRTGTVGEMSATYCENPETSPNMCENDTENCNLWSWSGAKAWRCHSCRSRKINCNDESKI